MGDESVDDLFSDASATSRPAIVVPLALVGVGVFVAVAGLVCTSAPGGVMVLAGWLMLERQQQRVDAGALPLEASATIRAAMRTTYAAVALVIVLFVTQLVLYCSGYYDTLWGVIFGAIRLALA